MDESCICCASELEKGVSQRRRLYSPPLCRVVPTLFGLLTKDFCEDNVLNILPRKPSKAVEESTFVCMKCFRNLEKHL